MTTGNKPTLIAYAVNGTGKRATWTRIGAAWPHNHTEGFNIELTALPLDSRIILMPPKPEPEQAEPAGEGAAP